MKIPVLCAFVFMINILYIIVKFVGLHDKIKRKIPSVV